MTKIWIIPLLLLLNSCFDKTKSFEEFEYLLIREFIGVKQVDLKTSVGKNDGEEISGAPMSWVTVLQALKPASSLSGVSALCVGYRIPYMKDNNKQYGILKIQRALKDKCPEYYDKENGLEGITYFSLIKNKDLLEIQLMLTGSNLTKKIQIPIQAHHTTDQKNKGIMHIAFDEDNNLTPLVTRDKIRSIKPREKCFDINTKCEILKSDQCQECEYGYFEVAGSSCKEGAIRMCLPVDCGEKNMPACVRSKKVDGENWCYQNSEAGFCKDGLNTYCGSEGYLICL
jgi:hypothetical protein